jgi:prolyl-tRNA synthetase
MEEVPTPGIASIEQVSAALSVASDHIAKTLIIRGDEGPLALVLRGDHELNELKAARLPGAIAPLEFASDEEIEAIIGCKPGSLGPVGCPIPCFVDRDAAALADFICGANANDAHYRGVNWDRDVALAPEQVVDIRNVVAGDMAPNGQGTLQFLRGIEVGHIFQLGKIYSEPLGASVLDATGRSITPIMGCYGMGVTRLVAAIIEQNHDEVGIIWPYPVAPYALHIIALNYGKSDAVRAAADTLYDACQDAGIETLLDDRDDRPGAKFADADLLGIPQRVVIGERGLKDNTVEYRQRQDSENQAVAVAAALAHVQQVARANAP